MKHFKIFTQQLEHSLWEEESYADYIISNAFIWQAKSLYIPYILPFVTQMPIHYKTSYIKLYVLNKLPEDKRPLTM